jgi:ankyrin repeat protein
MKLLLAAGVDVRRVSSKGYTCLHTAVIHARPIPVLCLLIKAGADVKAVDHSGHTAADIAHSMGSKLAESLLRRVAQDK